MKNTYKVLVLAALFSVLATGAVYADDNVTPSVSPAVTGGFRTLRQEIRTERENERKQIQTDRKNAQTTILNLKNSAARLVNATVTANNTTSLTVSNGTTSYTVNIDSKTKLRRLYWGSASEGEISVNDKVNVWGMFTDSSKTAINATLIRDLSIQKRYGVFFGSVAAINGNMITIQTINRGTQNVTVDSSTKYIDRKGQTISLSDIAVGHRIRVRGMWDKVNSAITEVKEIKDFTLPVVAHPTVSPTPTS